ncbi:hypothetical protein [Micromonospora halophytica]|uniref:Uncharacterized protein n=1 Tax=Micromonospora halophytica TaxID=47864 RepID=A0A1C5H9Z0_9ACTN|nr:hypothetical protein [Micromonospora halophytica]SCG42753.1 hypothetical protein GA0070560_103342 [Micromonospora halophytica]
MTSSESTKRQSAAWGLGLLFGVVIGLTVFQDASGVAFGIAIGVAFAVAFGAMSKGGRAKDRSGMGDVTP